MVTHTLLVSVIYGRIPKKTRFSRFFVRVYARVFLQQDFFFCFVCRFQAFWLRRLTVEAYIVRLCTGRPGLGQWNPRCCDIVRTV